MTKPLYYKVFAFALAWTLGLLWLGSVVHATGSSLACPDWPTCFGSMTPEMTGGVFWEHLHRLIAGGLILIFLLGTGLAWKPEVDRPWIRRLCWIGILALLLQAVLGGLTVIFLLPPAISTSHLAMAYLFLGLLVVLILETGPSRDQAPEPDPIRAGSIRRRTMGVVTLVFLQSLVGAWVRHAEAGMACPDVPLCLGQAIPPFHNGLIALHFSHRVLGYVVLAAALWLAWSIRGLTSSARLQRLTNLAAAGVVAQILLGFASVYTTLAVGPVSMHTVVAASVLALLVAVVNLTRPGRIDEAGTREAGDPSPAGDALGG